ncbi:PREDICTED: von Willebrand factor A domain-containing protein 7-like [Lipotes vexillifer]|uniref:von Willebrand factor A domain-containing protein 7-like n=1 Tax=Lipotes vexillifer TaxID=118797 RepID=A0A340XDX7_LIPVE|nr:PREDICTED: von Willebrand factor A domain-containing protein 7-like [Lipotes vexillifer]
MLPTDEPLSHLGPSLLLLLQLQLLLPPASAFFPNIWSLLAAPGSITHQDLTEEAALNVTLQLFLEQPPPGRPPLRLEDFLGRTLLADNLFAAYFGPGSPSRRFRAALGEVSRANAAQDFLPTSRNDPDLHFDAERLGQGRTRLVGALGETVVAARALDHSLARQRLGAALHALQDFYSHSNWVELGKQQPHPHLLWPRQGLRNLAQAQSQPQILSLIASHELQVLVQKVWKGTCKGSSLTSALRPASHPAVGGPPWCWLLLVALGRPE